MAKEHTKVKNLFLRLLKKHLKKVLTEEAGPALIKKILDQYELELYGIAAATDPTAPEYWVNEFTELLYADLEETMKITGKGFSFGLGDKEALGYLSRPLSTESQDVLKTFSFILEGNVGEYAWITPDLYEAKRGPGSWDPDWGRFGLGFLIPEEEFYLEGWDAYASFDSVRFGFSGEPPKDIFFNAYADFDWTPYIVKAVEGAAKELKGKSI